MDALSLFNKLMFSKVNLIITHRSVIIMGRGSGLTRQRLFGFNL
jgi:hypothetical protein